jgi:hypothetical protein
VAATRDGLTTGFDISTVGDDGKLRSVPWLYYRQMAVGGVAWFLYQEQGYNVYWDQPASVPPPALPPLLPAQ